MPITTEVAVLPGASQRPLGAYLASLASEEPDPADLLAVPVEPGRRRPAIAPSIRR